MADDELSLDAKDLLDIFGAEEGGNGSSQDLTKSIEDLFFSDEDEGKGEKLSLDGIAEAPELPSLSPVVDEPLVEDRKGMTEEEWRASPDYADFKRQVIERHLKKKAEEEAAKRGEQERAEQAARQQAAEVDLQKRAEDDKRKQELVDKYKAAKAATIAQRAQAFLQGQEQSATAGADAEKDKEAKLKTYLADLKAKMAQGGMAKVSMKLPGVPAPSAAGTGLDLSVELCKQLAAMFEITREETIKWVGEKIGKKAAQTMMMKTLAKVAKVHLDIFGRAAVNAKNELREDGALDQERLSRAFYAVPAPERVNKLQKALFELIEMRFIAVELGLGPRTKGFVISKALDGMDKAFKKNGYNPILLKWYQTDVVPSTSLSEGEEDAY